MSLLRHAGLAQADNIRGFIQSADFRHPEILSGLKAGYARKTIVGAQRPSLGELGQHPPGHRRRISPVVMRITFPTGNVDIPAGTSVMLGRDPAESLVAAAFAHFDNVSRRHATVQVDDAGHATIRDEGSTNGTYVNEDRVLPGSEVRLVDGDRVRLAADVTGSVSLPQGEPDPSGLSRNGVR